MGQECAETSGLRLGPQGCVAGWQWVGVGGNGSANIIHSILAQTCHLATWTCTSQTVISHYIVTLNCTWCIMWWSPQIFVPNHTLAVGNETGSYPNIRNRHLGNIYTGFQNESINPTVIIKGDCPNPANAMDTSFHLNQVQKRELCKGHQTQSV